MRHFRTVILFEEDTLCLPRQHLGCAGIARNIGAERGKRRSVIKWLTTVLLRLETGIKKSLLKRFCSPKRLFSCSVVYTCVAYFFCSDAGIISASIACLAVKFMVLIKLRMDFTISSILALSAMPSAKLPISVNSFSMSGVSARSYS